MTKMSNLCYRKNEEIVKVEAVEELEDGDVLHDEVGEVVVGNAEGRGRLHRLRALLQSLQERETSGWLKFYDVEDN